MKKWVNGQMVDMTEEEVKAMRDAQLSQVWKLTPEERLDKLEQVFEKLLAMLSKLLPGLEEL